MICATIAAESSNSSRTSFDLLSSGMIRKLSCHFTHYRSGCMQMNGACDVEKLCHQANSFLKRMDIPSDCNHTGQAEMAAIDGWDLRS